MRWIITNEWDTHYEKEKDLNKLLKFMKWEWGGEKITWEWDGERLIYEIEMNKDSNEYERENFWVWDGGRLMWQNETQDSNEMNKDSNENEMEKDPYENEMEEDSFEKMTRDSKWDPIWTILAIWNAHKVHNWGTCTTLRGTCL